MQRVCAVIVTHNRKALLRESLQALLDQSRPLQCIVVIDNVSSDGTSEMLAAEFPQVRRLATSQNVGSAGGFSIGLRWAMEQGFDWVWTLDDDSIADREALASLLKCWVGFPALDRPQVLGCKVVWTDGDLHPTNVQRPKLYNQDQQFLAAEHGAMSIRFTSFVGMMLSRKVIEQYGLPIAGYLMWNDDVEYSARILRKEFGVVVPASVITHKTIAKVVNATSTGAKFYFEIRNKLWLLRLSQAFSRGEKWWMAKSLARRTFRHLSETGFAWESVSAICRGIFDSVRRDPQREIQHLPTPIQQAMAA